MSDEASFNACPYSAHKEDREPTNKKASVTPERPVPIPPMGGHERMPLALRELPSRKLVKHMRQGLARKEKVESLISRRPAQARWPSRQ